MELLAFGERGLPVLAFPISNGRFFDFENQGMIDALSPKIDAGLLKLFCVDSIDAESWLNQAVHPHERVTRQVAYESYIVFEVAPLMRAEDSAQFAALGCGSGAYQAFNLAMRHPDLTSSCIALSGIFDRKLYMNGYYDQELYFNNPSEYLPNTSESRFLDRYRQMRIVLAAGDQDSSLQESYLISEILRRKEIPHLLDIWLNESRRDWDLWRVMAPKFF